MREAHGTPELPAACRAYRDAAGLPDDPALLGLFLDCGESELVVAALDAMIPRVEAREVELSKGQQSQLRTLAMGSDDAVADAAEALLECWAALG